MIRARQKAACEARGEEWVAPEVQAVRDEEKFLAESEEIFAKELKERCSKKGLDYEKELREHNELVSAKREKAQQKRRLAQEKAEEKARRCEEKRAARLASMTQEQLAKKEEKDKERAEREEAFWQKEKSAGEEYYKKVRAELARCAEGKAE